MTVADRVPISVEFSRRLQQLGLDTKRLLHYAGLAPELLESTSKPRISTKQFFKLWEAVALFSDDPSIGLRLVSEGDPGHLDVGSMVAADALNLGEALEKMARYKRLVCPEEVRICGDALETRVEFSWVHSELRPPEVLIDACFASVLALAQRGLGPGTRPLRTEYARSESNRVALEGHFGHVVFGAKADCLVFTSESLGRSFVRSDFNLLGTLGASSDESIFDLAGIAGHEFLVRVRREVVRQMHGQRPSVDGVARALAMSGRSLQRRLRQYDTSYQDQLDRVRWARALHFLAATQLEDVEVAFVLGFEEPNSFIRAFSRWERMTPLQWRSVRAMQPLQDYGQTSRHKK